MKKYFYYLTTLLLVNFNVKISSCCDPVDFLKDFGFNLSENVLHIIPDISEQLSRGELIVSKAILKLGVSVNRKDKNGNTPLHKAVKLNNHDAVKLLLKYNANTNDLNNNQETPIFYAKDRDIINLLTKKGAKINLTNKYGQTPLHVTIINDKLLLHPENILKLVTKKNLNQQDYKGKTPLHFAVEQSNTNTIKFLIKHNANINITDKENKNVIDIAKSNLNNTTNNLLSTSYKIKQLIKVILEEHEEERQQLKRQKEILDFLELTQQLDLYFENKINKNLIKTVSIDIAKLFIIRALHRNSLVKLQEVISIPKLKQNFIYKIFLVKIKKEKPQDNFLEFINFLINNNIGKEEIFNINKPKTQEINRVKNILKNNEFKIIFKNKEENLINNFSNWYINKVKQVLLLDEELNNINNNKNSIKVILEPYYESLASEKEAIKVRLVEKSKPIDLDLNILNKIYSYT